MNQTVLNHPAASLKTPPKRLTPLGLAKYKARFEEIVRANKERRESNSIPLNIVERVQMPEFDFQKLYEALGGGELGYRCLPRVHRVSEHNLFRWQSIFYNPRTCTGIIKWMPSGVHEVLASPFIVSAGIARLNLGPDIEKQLRVVGSQKVGNF